MSFWEYIWNWPTITKWLYHLNWNANDSSWNWYNWTATNVTWKWIWLNWYCAEFLDWRAARITTTNNNTIYTIIEWIKFYSFPINWISWVMQWTSDSIWWKLRYSADWTKATIKPKVNSTDYTVTKTINDFNWHMIAMVRDWSNLKVYIDAVLEFNQATSWTTTWNVTIWTPTYDSVWTIYHNKDEIILDQKVWTQTDLKKYYTQLKWRFWFL